MLRKRNRFTLATGIFLAIVVCLLCWRARQSLQREKISRKLIASIDDGKVAESIQLLREGADPNAFENYQEDLSLWQTLLHVLPQRLTNKNRRGDPVLLLAIHRVLSYGDDPDLVNPLIHALVQRGADVNALGGAGDTPLSFLCDWPTTDLASYLLQHDADVNRRNEDGSTALMAAAMTGNTALLQLLLDHHAQIDAQDRQGWSALVYAIQGSRDATINGHTPCLTLLISRGANVNIHCQRNGSLSTPLRVAQENRQSDLVEILKQAGAREK